MEQVFLPCFPALFHLDFLQRLHSPLSLSLSAGGEGNLSCLTSRITGSAKSIKASPLFPTREVIRMQSNVPP